MQKDKEKFELNDEDLQYISGGKTAPIEHEEPSCYNSSNMCGDCFNCCFSLNCSNPNKSF